MASAARGLNIPAHVPDALFCTRRRPESRALLTIIFSPFDAPPLFRPFWSRTFGAGRRKISAEIFDIQWGRRPRAAEKKAPAPLNVGLFVWSRSLFENF